LPFADQTQTDFLPFSGFFLVYRPQRAIPFLSHGPLVISLLANPITPPTYPPPPPPPPPPPRFEGLFPPHPERRQVSFIFWSWPGSSYRILFHKEQHFLRLYEHVVRTSFSARNTPQELGIILFPFCYPCLFPFNLLRFLFFCVSGVYFPCLPSSSSLSMLVFSCLGYFLKLYERHFPPTVSPDLTPG